MIPPELWWAIGIKLGVAVALTKGLPFPIEFNAALPNIPPNNLNEWEEGLGKIYIACTSLLYFFYVLLGEDVC